ncbi:Gfo/Idh/MocA family protein [Pseudodesulfovibrio sediminis]|uniref:Uncharacterized protein n=1 Tax=Pseudodesulfovibrio sediminis TaxID=2810563 RepID=A0ABM7P3X1_9BACT|nr:Gfo/Idh/MocA family oxidoreductase [Pseudodesulfovibrio sediminis]BCS87545.1 hypothetical protein PSDVSF_07870 [Pseudodesulfovibrio sediminis]
MLALIIGYGSIGARHARLLNEMGHEIACVTGNPDCPYTVYSSIEDALAETQPWLAIVSTATVNHYANLQALRQADFTGRILVEKPLFQNSCECDAVDTVCVAYNLRFHPLATRTRELLTGQRILNAQFHVGQYLPDWRPGTDYSTSYSASSALGGGVLRDLSHELDLAQFLLGKWKRVTAVGGKFSDLNIDSDDQFSILMETASCPATSIHMDYLSRTPRRGFDITTPDMSLRADFINNILLVDGSIEDHPSERDTTYRNQLQALVTDAPHLCSFEQGLEIVRLIEAIEKSATSQCWVEA